MHCKTVVYTVFHSPPTWQQSQLLTLLQVELSTARLSLKTTVQRLLKGHRWRSWVGSCTFSDIYMAHLCDSA